MDYKKLAQNYSLEEVVALNRLLDYLLEQPYRRTKEFLEGARAEGELLEQAIFENMMTKPAPF